MEARTLALRPTMDPAGSLSTASIYPSDLHFELAPRLGWLLEINLWFKQFVFQGRQE